MQILKIKPHFLDSFKQYLKKKKIVYLSLSVTVGGLGPGAHYLCKY